MLPIMLSTRRRYDTLVVFAFPAVVRCRRQANVAGDLSAILERPIEDFTREHRCKLGAEAVPA